jgi:hypothetical protein
MNGVSRLFGVAPKNGGAFTDRYCSVDARGRGRSEESGELAVAKSCLNRGVAACIDG